MRALALDLSRPADPVRAMARVAALLSKYFDKNTPSGIRDIEAQDWAEALREYPFWAIEAACRWWTSAENPERRKRPLEGDIAARCIHEMDGIGVALRGGLPAIGMGADPNPSEPRCTAQAAAEIMAQHGFAPKRFGGCEE